MYVYYEHIISPVGLHALLTDVVLSSNGRTSVIKWSDKREGARAEIISSIFKSILPENREYEVKTHIWTFTGTAGYRVIELISKAIQGGILSNITLASLRDLKDLASKGDFRWKPYIPPAYSYQYGKTPTVYDEKEFFYTPSTPKVTGIPSGDALFVALAELMNITAEQLKAATQQELKKSYRSACMRLHPDKGGDSKKMSELTMLWGAYNAS